MRGYTLLDFRTSPKKMCASLLLGKRKRCGQCTGCLSLDCGTCNFCKDMVKFGGQGKKKQCCKQRKCVIVSAQPTESNPTTDHITPQLPRQNPYTIADFLTQSNRKVHSILGDGSCLFRSISYQLFHTQIHHFKVRSNLVC